MGYFIDSNNAYYEGDKVSDSDIETPQRPNYYHVYINGEWAVEPILEAKQLRENADLVEYLDGKNDAAIIALLNQTRAQWITWVGSNLTFIVLPAERNRMGTLFWLVALCARKILR